VNADQARLYAAVMRRHGRPGYHGRPMRCVPSTAERDGSTPRLEPEAADNRVIFVDRDHAEAAVAEFTAAGSHPMEPYPCKRSRTGHWHIRVTTAQVTREDGGTQP
jgi:hypothetical protein